MLKSKQLLRQCLGLVTLALLVSQALATRERIRFEPQIHKEVRGNDADFSSVSENNQQPVEPKFNSDKLNRALGFLAGFRNPQQEGVEEEEEEESELSNRAFPSEGFELYGINNFDPRFDEGAVSEDQGFGNNNYYNNNDDFEQSPLAGSYLQSLLGRYGEKSFKQKSSANGKMSSDSEIKTEEILTTKAPRAGAMVAKQSGHNEVSNATSMDFFMIAVLGCLAVAAAVGVILSVFCFVKMQRRSRSTQRYDYSGPGNGSGIGTGKKGSHDSLNGSAAASAASKLSAIFGGHGSTASVDKKLANNATLYHFEHHKKEMMAAEAGDGAHHGFGDSDAESGDENDENDYTVYECPGLAPTGEMQVDNPLFRIKQQASQPGSQASSSASSSVSPPVVVHGMQPPK